jgi:peptidoglycan hydrolase-like protein with peptidoglycan-binding domain
MRKNVLRVGLALLVLGAILPGAASAQTEGGTASPAQETRPTMPARWIAGPVHRWTGYHRAGGSLRVRELQRRLNRLGYRAGPVDGLFGPKTERATLRFQRSKGLRPDAIVGRRTLRALRRDDARRRRQAPPSSERRTTRPQERPSIRAPQPTPERIAPEPPRAVQAPVQPGPDLPVVPVLVAFALLGVATFVASYLRTRARIETMREGGRASQPRGPTLGQEPGR